MASNDEKQALREYLKTVPPGERIWIIRLTGHEKVPERQKLVEEMAKAAHKSRKKPWDLFKVRLLLDDDNEYDPHAVQVLVVKKDGLHQIGFVKQKHLNEVVGHNKAVRFFLQKKGVIMDGDHPKLRVMHVDYNAHDNLRSCVLALHTVYGLDSLPVGCSKFSNKGIPIKETPAPKHGEIPVVESNDYPTSSMIDKLINYSKLLERHFGLVETYKDEDGKEQTSYCVPVFLSQWHGDPIAFKSHHAISKYLADATEPLYGSANTTRDLPSVEEEYGPIMAEHFYRLTGVFEGPMTRRHVTAVLTTLASIMPTLNAFESPETYDE